MIMQKGVLGLFAIPSQALSGLCRAYNSGAKLGRVSGNEMDNQRADDMQIGVMQAFIWMMM